MVLMLRSILINSKDAPISLFSHTIRHSLHIILRFLLVQVFFVKLMMWSIVNVCSDREFPSQSDLPRFSIVVSSVFYNLLNNRLGMKLYATPLDHIMGRCQDRQQQINNQ